MSQSNNLQSRDRGRFSNHPGQNAPKSWKDEDDSELNKLIFDTHKRTQYKDAPSPQQQHTGIPRNSIQKTKIMNILDTKQYNPTEIIKAETPKPDDLWGSSLGTLENDIFKDKPRGYLNPPLNANNKSPARSNSFTPNPKTRPIPKPRKLSPGQSEFHARPPIATRPTPKAQPPLPFHPQPKPQPFLRRHPSRHPHLPQPKTISTTLQQKNPNHRPRPQPRLPTN
jgi:hypothetical protein